jgi:hypothetical protein
MQGGHCVGDELGGQSSARPQNGTAHVRRRHAAFASPLARALPSPNIAERRTIQLVEQVILEAGQYQPARRWRAPMPKYTRGNT